jgi:hypothetical protein
MHRVGHPLRPGGRGPGRGLGGGLDGEPVGPLLFDGELLVTEQGVVVGSSLTEELYPVALPIGWHPLRVYADRLTDPARFTVVFDGEPAPP